MELSLMKLKQLRQSERVIQVVGHKTRTRMQISKTKLRSTPYQEREEKRNFNNTHLKALSLTVMLSLKV